jgi:hypothetical protein
MLLPVHPSSAVEYLTNLTLEDFQAVAKYFVIRNPRYTNIDLYVPEDFLTSLWAQDERAIKVVMLTLGHISFRSAGKEDEYDEDKVTLTMEELCKLCDVSLTGEEITNAFQDPEADFSLFYDNTDRTFYLMDLHFTSDYKKVLYKIP